MSLAISLTAFPGEFAFVFEEGLHCRAHRRIEVFGPTISSRELSKSA